MKHSILDPVFLTLLLKIWNGYHFFSTYSFNLKEVERKSYLNVAYAPDIYESVR